MKVLMIVVNILSFHQQDMQIQTKVTSMEECQYMQANPQYNSSIECVPLVNL
ncbi:MAG: hypothetical protein PQ612_05620 [Rickettsiales bacterium]|nr:hypothetical protein [Pseudomonadota bacterium]MDA0966498.1 hypothetical protein [Pseudomonadota bacterium]MDG4543360.1 hypothetical protein [Rickettsiales bacterium]MDG4545626.1 hypothetical protein [Rickettsiales bacterium]MDG4548075.1 hypothetical protein [Rickettsiales bacterium]